MQSLASVLFNFFVLFVAGFYVFYKNPQGKINLTFMFSCFAIGAWDFVDYMFRVSKTYDAAFLWSLGYPLVIPLTTATMYYFILALIEKKEMFNHWFSNIVVVGGTIVSMFLGFLAGYSDPMITYVNDQWEIVAGNALISRISDNFMIYSGLIAIVVVFYFLIKYTLHLYDPLKKKQLWLMFWGTIISNIPSFGELFVWFSIPLPPLLHFIFIDTTPISVPLWVTFFAYAIIRYDMFSINTASASEMMFETMSDASLLLNKELKVVAANSSAENMFGISRQELVGTAMHDLIIGKNDIEEKMIMQLIHQNQFSDFEVVVAHNKTPASLSGAFIDTKWGIDRGVVCLFRDITERKRHEQEVRRELAKLQLIIESVGEGMIVVDNEDNILLVNERARQMFRNNTLTGHHFYTVFKLVTEKQEPFKLAEKTTTHLEKYGEYKIPFTDRLYLKISDTIKIPIMVTMTSLKLDNASEGIIVMFEDVTKEMEIDAAKSSFVSLAAHQLRTPSTALNWGLEALEDDINQKLDDTMKETFQSIKKSAQAMAQLITQFLNVSRIEMGRLTVNPTLLSLNTIIEEVLNEQHMYAQLKRQKLTYKESKQIKEIPLDAMLIRMVVQNLISNAIKYTPEKGIIAVKLTSDKKGVVLEVKDNGIGIPKNQLPHLFEKLFRADNAIKAGIEGNGLGLYVVREIVRLTGGDIICDSVENKGTTFTVTIPYSGMTAKAGSVTLE